MRAGSKEGVGRATCFLAWKRRPLEPFACPHWSLGLLGRVGPTEDFFRSWEGKTLALGTAFDGSSSGPGIEKFP